MIRKLTILCLLLTQILFSQQLDSLRYEFMLNGEQLDDSLKSTPFINTFAISSDNYLTLASENQLYLLGWGGIVPFGNKSDQKINSFAYTSDGLLLLIKETELCYLNELGSCEKLIELPTNDMQISNGNEVMYLFEQNKNTGSSILIAYAKGGKFKQILKSPKPINAVVEMADNLIVAIESSIFSYNPSTEQLELVTAFSKDNKVISLAVDKERQILYLSTLEGIYAFKNEQLDFLTGDFKANIITHFKNGLVFYDSAKKEIIRIVNIDKSI